MSVTLNLPLAHKKEIAKNTYELGFSLGNQTFSFVSGQYISVLLPENGDGKYTDTCHEFSLTNTVAEPVLTIVFRGSDSRFKQTLLGRQVGDVVILEGPFGIFYPPENVKKLLMIAGGVGIAPFMSILRNRPTFNATLLYCNSEETSVPYIEELRSMLNLELYEHYSRIEKLDSVDDDTFVMIAGPPKFVRHVRQLANTVGVRNNHVLFEEFTGEH